MDALAQRMGSAVFAFRGYNVTNLGRTPELLAHKVYGPTVARYLAEGGEICSDIVHRKVDLVDRVKRREETSLACYDEAVTLIVATELAQLRLLAEFFDVHYQKARFSYGYSLGELTAVIASGLYEMQAALRLPLELAADCVALAEGVTMGVVFSRGPMLDFGRVQALCVRINLEGRGVIGISSYLAPNALLVLGQGGTIDRLSELMHDTFPTRVYLRKNTDQWPPMHTPLVWLRNIPNRAGVMMHTLPGGLHRPNPPIFSLVTGSFGYDDHNSRDILNRWIDQPQRLWDAIYETLAQGIKTVIHVGPDPNLIPATFHRLSDNVKAQLSGRSLNSMGLRAVSRAVTRPWLGALLPSRSALLRAPMIEHVILEDWLLKQEIR